VDDRRSEFLILVGDICLAAGRARLPVEVEHLDGTCVAGVPSQVTPARGGEEVDSTGYGNTIGIGGATINLRDITRCTVSDT
jgi:hypothetical protein